MATDSPTNAIIQYFKNDAFAEFTGIELMDVKDGWAKAKLAIKPQHLNALGLVHGGVIFTLADLAFAAASNSRGHAAVAINNTIAYAKAPQGDILYAECREVTGNHKLATFNAQVTDAQGEIIAVFQGTVYKKNTKLSYTE